MMTDKQLAALIYWVGQMTKDRESFDADIALDGLLKEFGFDRRGIVIVPLELVAKPRTPGSISFWPEVEDALRLLVRGYTDDSVRDNHVGFIAEMPAPHRMEPGMSSRDVAAAWRTVRKALGMPSGD